MDKYLTRSSSSGSLCSKRRAEDDDDHNVLPKRPATNVKNQAKYDKSRDFTSPNRFAMLSTDGDTESNKEAETMSSPFKVASTTIAKAKHIPPIIMDLKADLTHEGIKQIVNKYTNRFHLQYKGSNKVAIICYTPEAHQSVKEGFRKENAPFLTYTRKDEKTPKIVIKGLPAFVEDHLAGELDSLGFKEVTVTKLKSKTNDAPCPPFLIQLSAGSDLTKFRRIKYLFNCVINMQKYKPNRLAGTQCYRCQGFGHSSRNCNMPARCVKCTDSHLTSECPKKDREAPATCCNCMEKHPANYGKCKARLSYLQRVEQKKEQERKPLFIAPQKQMKPAVLKNKTWADVASKQTSHQEPPPVQEIPTPLQPKEDQDIKDMLEILQTLKKIKNQFTACTSMLEKVMLILTHLGRYV